MAIHGATVSDRQTVFHPFHYVFVASGEMGQMEELAGLDNAVVSTPASPLHHRLHSTPLGSALLCDSTWKE